MRKRIKVYSFKSDDRVVSLEDEKPEIANRKVKELTFKFEFDKKSHGFEIAPLSEEKLLEKAIKTKT